MVRFKRQIARALVCAAGLMSAAGAQAVTLPPHFQETVAFSGLENPTALEFASDGRVFVAEKSGRILVYSSLADATPTLFADLSTNVYNFWDRGLLGLALAPGFPDDPHVYVSYTHDAEIGGTAPLWGLPGVLSDPCPNPPGATADGCVVSGRLSRLEAAGDQMTGSEHVLIEDWCQQFPSHSVGDLAFGPDGALYATGGDGASFTFADYGQNGSPKNPCGDPPSGVGGTQSPPTAQGGALRSQDLLTRSPGDPVGLGGTVIRVDPATGSASAGNPLWSDPDPNARRIVAHGFRNPFRITFRPGTSELWLGDVGADTAEEIDRLVDIAGPVENYGWPCYEGGGGQWEFSALGLDLCTQVYGSGTTTFPVFHYSHREPVFDGDPCQTDAGSSTSGLAFGPSGFADYEGALFFADYSRNCIWVLRAGGDGLPDPDLVETFAADAAGPVDLKFGPGGDLFYADLGGGTIRRIRHLVSNSAPVASASASVTQSLTPPLTVDFDATASTDPDVGDALSYAWDLDGDGGLDDSTSAQPSHTYLAKGMYTVTLAVTDPYGATDTDTVVITVGSPPAPAIGSPAAGSTWRVGEALAFSGSASDAEDGALPASSLDWSLFLHHCTAPLSCHVHPIQDFEGVSSGSFAAPDHAYPSYLELQLTATDSDGITSTTSRRLDPRSVTLSFATNPQGLRLVVGPAEETAPFNRVVIVGSATTVTAPTPQSVSGTAFSFSGWSDGRARSHEVVAPADPAGYTATFVAPPPPLPEPPAAPSPPPPSTPPPTLPQPPRPVVRCVVPALKGRTLAAARRAIVASKCTVGRVSRAYSRTVRSGRVVSQAPRPRLRLRRGTKVHLVVSRGRRR
jgi:glucose/arabinose dehydrogenase/PKD repeat protein